jgi:hypothetical protein
MFVNGNSGDTVYLDSKISPIDTSIITFKDPNTELIFEINKEGQIIIGKGYTPTEAADMFLERLSHLLPNFVNAKTDMLQKENDELSRRVKELQEENQLFAQANNDLVMVAQAWRENVMQLEQNR